MKRTIGSCLLGRENNFDFIRFVAALAVIFSHSFYLTNSTEQEPLMLFTSGRFDTAHLSVAIFFVISGLLITMSYERSKSLHSYFEARILRIYPALIVVIFCTVFILGPIASSYSLKEYFINSQTIKYFLSNTFMARVQYTLPGVFEHGVSNTVNASLWTLPIELACYCFVAVAGLLVSKKIKSGLILGVLSLAVFYYVFFNGFSALLFYFLFGALLYLFKDKIVLNGVVAVVSFLVLLANLHYNTDPGANFVVKSMNIIIKGASLSYVIMYLSFIKTTHIKNFAKSGDYSYGLYIWAFPLQQIISRSFEGLNAYSLFVLSAIATLFFAALSWHLIEKNALRLKNKLVYKQTQPYANVGV